MDNLTQDQHATNDATWHHIYRVGELLDGAIVELIQRRRVHDQSKLRSPEVDILTEVGVQLGPLTYGSPEYTSQLHQSDMKTYLAHHYANNRHHPEHHKNGVNDMTLTDLVEMLCDWKAASERHNDGNINMSIEINAERFGLSPQLVRILHNTAHALFR